MSHSYRMALPLVRKLPRGAAVMDLGCGAGLPRVARSLAEDLELALEPDHGPPRVGRRLDSWTEWAQADRIDPVLSGVYKTRPNESDD